MNSDEYYVSFRSYGIMVRATNTEDAIIVAKSYAIQKGYARPTLVSIKFSDGAMQYFCRVCGLEQVKTKESICNKCIQEQGYATTKQNSANERKPNQPHK